MKAKISVSITEKEFIKAKYLDMGENPPKNKKELRQDMIEYLEENLYEIVEEWVLHKNIPFVEIDEATK